MISVSEALKIMQDRPYLFDQEVIGLGQACGRVLLKSIHADRDFPPFNRVMMDGIAIRHQDYVSGQTKFPITMTIAAGQGQQHIQGQGTAVEIMTGAVMPEGLDTVIRYEDLTIDDGTATIMTSQVVKGANVHPRAFDRSGGSLIVKAPTTISPAEIGVAATVGSSRVTVAKMPHVAVVSTGDELVPIDQVPLPHQIRASNAPTIAAMLEKMGCSSVQVHLMDDREWVREKLASLLKEYSVILLIGGSSKGKFDYVPQTLRELGVTECFYRVKQRPGKPFMFGTYGQNQFVFALPGNPVSAFICMQYYFTYWMGVSLGLKHVLPNAALTESVEFKPDLTYFLQARIVNQDATLKAIPVRGHGSGDLANLADADAFLIMPRGQSDFPAGSIYPFISYRFNPWL